LRELIAACPFEPSPADLALFLYDLLSPESRVPAIPFDGTSTNPLSPEHDVFPPPPITLDAESPEPTSLERAPSPVVSGGIFGGPALRFVTRMRWVARAAAVAAAVAGLLFANFSAHRRTPSAGREESGIAIATPSAVPSPLWRIGLENAAILSSPSVLRPSIPMILERVAGPQSGLPAVRRDAKLRSSVESLRLKAALARVAAERLDAEVHAPTVLQEGRSFEQQGEKLLRRGRFGAAKDAYTRALDLFAKAESLSREERVRTIRVASNASTS